MSDQICIPRGDAIFMIRIAQFFAGATLGLIWSRDASRFRTCAFSVSAVTCIILGYIEYYFNQIQ